MTCPDERQQRSAPHPARPAFPGWRHTASAHLRPSPAPPAHPASQRRAPSPGLPVPPRFPRIRPTFLQTVTRRLVLRTDAMIVATSSGRMVRRSITSAEIPCSAKGVRGCQRLPARQRERGDRNIRALAQSWPCQWARPIIRVRHFKRLAIQHTRFRGRPPGSGCGSRLSAGLSHQRAIGRNARSGPAHGRTSWHNIASACAPTRAAAPFGPRNTIGQPIWPPDMYSVFARRVDDLVNALHRKVPGHKLHNGLNRHRRANTQTRQSHAR